VTNDKTHSPSLSPAPTPSPTRRTPTHASAACFAQQEPARLLEQARDVGFDRISTASYGFLNGTPPGFPFSKGKNMSWETPSFIEIDMSAEIGSYEGEDYDGL
jgi:coenzyme PQQ precursor peptide PqqA